MLELLKSKSGLPSMLREALQTTYLYTTTQLFSPSMNLLAHAYLSFNDPPVLVGNMISDYVKGKKKFSYSLNIQKGIELHRVIDEFTDHHPANNEAKYFFKADYRLYAGAFVDVVYDHFLANDINQFADEAVLNLFAHNTYQSLAKYENIMPEPFAGMLPYMQSQNWLYNYRYNTGIERSFEGLVRRAAYLDESAVAFKIFEKEYGSLKKCYDAFFPDLKLLAENWVKENTG